MDINSDVFGDVGPLSPEESILAMLRGRPIARARMPKPGPEAEIPPFIPERRAPLAFPATRPVARVPALGSAPAYGPLTQEETASPEAGTLQRLRYEYEHPVTPLQPHGLKAFGEGLLSLVAPRVENFIQQRRFAPAYAQQNRITGLEREAQLLTPQQQPLQDVVKEYSDALARGDSAAAERLKARVGQFKQATERPPTTKEPTIEERIFSAEQVIGDPNATPQQKEQAQRTVDAAAKAIGFKKPQAAKPTGRFVNAEGHEMQVYSDGSTKDLGPARVPRGPSGVKAGARREGTSPGMKAGDWLKKMGF